MASDGKWRFLVDECMEPALAGRLRTAGLDARHVQEVRTLGKGADDEDDILPYLRREDTILITNNFRDFGDIRFDDHEGILLDFDGRRSAREYARAVVRIVEAYPGRDALRHTEPLDDWV